MMSAEDRQSDPYKVYEVAEGIYWVGFADWDAGFSNNPYLLVSEDEAVLIDPGSVLHYHVVAKKVLEIVRPEQIKTIVVQHQDPDLCASVPKFESLIGNRIQLVVHPRAALFMPYYGITSELTTPADRQSITLAGRELQFFHTPYVHFAGAMMTWDATSKTLFSSDVFAGLSTDWKLFADDTYVEDTRAFTEPYVGSQTAWQAAVDAARSLAPNRICPQHGSIVDRKVESFLHAVAQFRVGRMLHEEAER